MNTNLNKKGAADINFKILTATIFIGFLIFGFSENIKGPAIPKLQAEFALSELHIGLLLALNSLGYLLACSYTGWLVKKIGIKTTTILCFATMSFAGVLIYFAPNYILFSGSYFVMYLGNGMLEISLGIMAATIFTKNTGTMMNLSHFFYGLSSMIAPLLSTSLMGFSFADKMLGWRGMYLIVLSFSLIPIIPALLSAFPKEDKNNHERISLKDFIKDPTPWLILTILSFGVIAEMSVGGWLVNFLEKSYSFKSTAAAGVLSGFFLCFMLARLLFGPFIDRIGFVKSILISSCFSGVSIVISILIGKPAIFLLAIAGFGIAPIYPTVMALMAKIFKNNIETALTFTLTLMGITIVIGNLLIGAITDSFKAIYTHYLGAAAGIRIGYSAGYMFVGLCCMICFGAAMVLYHKLKKNNSLY
ncbi:MAG: major facilitator superfamily 1 [Clostridia bacterium]|jgi:fucose permease|nr:major facilitator superfamily 1 [Clostridia bacterium]